MAKMLEKIVLSSILLLSSCTTSALEKQFRKDGIPGIKKISVTKTSDPVQTLIHVRSYHQATSNLNMEKWEKNLVNNTQEDLYQALEELSDKYHINIVYNEGTTDQTIEWEKNDLKSIQGFSLANISKEREKLKKTVQLIDSKIDALNRDINTPEYQKAESRTYLITTIQSLNELIPLNEQVAEAYLALRNAQMSKKGAAAVLYAEGKVDYRPGEDAELNQLALREFKELHRFGELLKNPHTNEITTSYDPKRYHQAVYEDRENYVLGRFVDEKPKIAVVYMGGGHNFTNNVTEWNKKYPHRKIRLITLTPKNFIEHKYEQ